MRLYAGATGERLSRWSRLRVHTYFVGELEKNFVEMGDAEVPFVVGQLRHHQLGKRGLSTVGKHVDVTGMMLLLLWRCRRRRRR